MMKIKPYNKGKWIVNVLTILFTIHSSLFTASIASAQGLPLIRNYTAAEYGGHNRCYDIEIGEDGTVFVANFEGLLYYDRSRWRVIHSPDISRVTVVFRDSKNTIWVGGYNFFARLQKRANGELLMQQVGENGLFEGEVMEIFEDGGSLQFVASDSHIYEVNGNAVTKKKRTNTKFNPGVESGIVSIEALKADKENVLLDDITQTLALDGGMQVKVKRNNGLVIADDQGHDLYTITEANGLCSNQVAYVAYDGHGMLWGATSHGIFSVEIPSVYSYFLAKVFWARCMPSWPSTARYTWAAPTVSTASFRSSAGLWLISTISVGRCVKVVTICSSPLPAASIRLREAAVSVA